MEKTFKALEEYLQEQGITARKYENNPIIKAQASTLKGTMFIHHNSTKHKPTEVAIEFENLHSLKPTKPPLLIDLNDPNSLETIVKAIIN